MQCAIVDTHFFLDATVASAPWRRAVCAGLGGLLPYRRQSTHPQPNLQKLIVSARCRRQGIATGLALSVFIFLYKSSESEPVSGVTAGSISVGRTKRPPWEITCLRRDGDRILVLFLQGQLFFGSAERVARSAKGISFGPFSVELRPPQCSTHLRDPNPC